MKLHNRSALALTLALAAALGAQEPAADPSPAAQFAAIRSEFDEAMKAFQTAYQAAKTDAERQEAIKHYPSGDDYAGRVRAIAEQHPTDPVAAEAITWVLQQGNGGPGADELLDILLAHHLDSDQMVEACKALQYRQTPKTEPFLRAVMQKSKQHAAQGWAGYVLAKTLQGEASLIRRLHDGAEPAMLDWLKQSRGEAKLLQMQKQDPADLQKQAEALLEEVVAKYGDVKSRSKSLADTAKADLFELRNLSVGKVAPEIEGTDVDGVAFKLSDYRGKVVFLDFWGYW